VILRRAHAEVTTTQTAAEARRLFQAQRPDVLISDIAMPDEDGYTLIHSIRSLAPAEGGQAPALALTAYAREEDRLKSLAAGFQAHLSKPVEPDELVSLVSQLATGGPRPAPAGTAVAGNS